MSAQGNRHPKPDSRSLETGQTKGQARQVLASNSLDARMSAASSKVDRQACRPSRASQTRGITWLPPLQN